MIAETANLATAHNVVKRALNRKLNDLRSLNQDYHFGRKLRASTRNAESTAIIEDSDVLTFLHTTRLEQKREIGCLMDCTPGKQRRASLCMLPGGGTSE